MTDVERRIGRIGNYYGNLLVKACYGSYFWAIPNYDGTDWEEIPQSLYNELVAFDDTIEREDE